MAKNRTEPTPDPTLVENAKALADLSDLFATATVAHFQTLAKAGVENAGEIASDFHAYLLDMMRPDATMTPFITGLSQVIGAVGKGPSGATSGNTMVTVQYGPSSLTVPSPTQVRKVAADRAANVAKKAAAAKKTPAKKAAPVKKTAKATPAKKTATLKAPAKKAPAKKTPSKAPARRTTPRATGTTPHGISW